MSRPARGKYEMPTPTFKLKPHRKAPAITSTPAAMTTTPVKRAARSGLDANLSTVIAAVTVAMAPRLITPITSRITMKPEQHMLQCTPQRRPCCQALRTLEDGDGAQGAAFRQRPSWRAFHAVS